MSGTASASRLKAGEAGSSRTTASGKQWEAVGSGQRPGETPPTDQQDREDQLHSALTSRNKPGSSREAVATGDRPVPVVLPGGDLWLPGELCPSLVAALAVAQPRSPDLIAVRNAAARAAVAHQQALHQTTAVRKPRDLRISADQLPLVADCAEIAAPLPTVTTAGASALVGLTERRWRQLATQGLVTASKDDGSRWLLDRRSVLDYARRRMDASSDSDSAGDRPGAAC